MSTSKSTRLTRIRNCLLAGTALCTSGVRASDINWSNTNGGTFSVGTNWIGGVVAGTGDFAHFGRTRPGNPQAAYTVGFSTNPANLGIVVEDDAVTFDLNAHAYSLTTTNNYAMRIGTTAGGTGRLTVTDGVIATAPDGLVYIGWSNAPGTLTLTTGAQLLGPRVVVGHLGPGTLIVQNGADVVGGPMILGAFTDVTGVAAIAGTGSAVVVEGLTIGDAGSGTMNISGGGRVESNSGNLGVLGFATGTVNVDGASSRWAISGDLDIGPFGRGTLNVTTGGFVDSASVTLGEAANGIGTVLVDGVNSRLTSLGGLSVGAGGHGTMTITGSGRVQSAVGFVGEYGTVTSIGSLTIDGNSQWINTGRVAVGEAGEGTMNIGGGSLVQCASGRVGNLALGRGTVTINGAGSRWINSEDLTVGNLGNGTLNISGGGRAESISAKIGENNTGTGTVNVVGANSRLLTSGDMDVGWSGNATVNVSAGGLMQSASGVLGVNDPGVGTVNIDGVNSRWTIAGDLKVGRVGQGTLNITNGGRVDSGAGFAPASGGATGSVTVSGNSQWISTDHITVGYASQGTLSILGGSLVQSVSGRLGSLGLGAGSVTVNGTGSRWINSLDVIVGGGGRGTLHITAGGEVVSAAGSIARSGNQSLVRVTGPNSRWTLTGVLTVGGDVGAGINGGLGLLEVQAGGVVSADSVFICPAGTVDFQGGTIDVGRLSPAFRPGGTFLFRGGVLHSNLIEFSLLNQGGTLAPGHSAGNITISGNYTQQAAGMLEIEIGGITPNSQFDRIDIGGIAIIDGTLDLRLINGFVPSPTQTLVVLDAGRLTGSFANVGSGERLPITGGGGSFVVHYGLGSQFDPSQIVLSNFGRCAADVNGDGVVDLFDYLDFVSAFSTQSPLADFNGDGVIDFFDYLDFVNAFSAGC